LKSQNFLDEDGIEDMHFYFVSFNSHNSKVLRNQEESKFRKSKLNADKAKNKPVKP
jgi:hypothetical protein